MQNSNLQINRTQAAQLASLILTVFTLWVWWGILVSKTSETALYFLDVGQGDSQLVVLASPRSKSEIRILIDGGPGRKVLEGLDQALGRKNNKYLDMLIMSHPHHDHHEGFIEVLRRYEVGLFVSNGQEPEPESESFQVLMAELERTATPMITLWENDAIRYGDYRLSVISPDNKLLELNDPDEASLILLLEAGETKTIFTGDAGFPAERSLLAKDWDLSADILKIGHHGSKNSTGENFLTAVRPTIAVIGVGQNRYGHPTARVLEALELAGSQIYRTDKDGHIKVALGDRPADKNSRLLSLARWATGNYGGSGLKIVSLTEARNNRGNFDLIEYQDCSFHLPQGKPTNRTVQISEVAWMGAETGATHEWLKLENLSGERLNLSGWQLINENGKIHFHFPQQTYFVGHSLLLARETANKILDLNADYIFSGSIRNTKEGLRLFNNHCELVDEALGLPNWPAGNNQTKQTMQRTGPATWRSSPLPGGSIKP